MQVIHRFKGSSVLFPQPLEVWNSFIYADWVVDFPAAYYASVPPKAKVYVRPNDFQKFLRTKDFASIVLTAAGCVTSFTLNQFMSIYKGLKASDLEKTCLSLLISGQLQIVHMTHSHLSDQLAINRALVISREDLLCTKILSYPWDALLQCLTKTSGSQVRYLDNLMSSVGIAKFRIFGSASLEVNIASSDIDVAVPNDMSLVELNNRLNSYAMKNNDVLVRFVVNAKVPVVRFVDNNVGVQIDFVNESGPLTSDLLAPFLGIEAKMLVRLLKHLWKSLDIRGVCGVPAFSIYCFVVVYVRRHSVMCYGIEDVFVGFVDWFTQLDNMLFKIGGDGDRAENQERFGFDFYDVGLTHIVPGVCSRVQQVLARVAFLFRTRSIEFVNLFNVYPIPSCALCSGNHNAASCSELFDLKGNVLFR